LEWERGGDTFFSNLKLTIPFLFSAIAGIFSFFNGMISILKKEKSILVFLSTLLGFLIFLFVLGEILFPH